jgi:hypothetical protein
MVTFGKERIQGSFNALPSLGRKAGGFIYDKAIFIFE